MFRLAIICFQLVSMIAHAAQEPWSLDELRRRFEVKGEVFVLGPSGKNVLYKSNMWSVWKTRDRSGHFESQWTSNSAYVPVAIRHKWKVQDDGSIYAEIEQYDRVFAANASSPENWGKLIKKQEFILENLEPITIVLLSDKDHRVVARFTPGFSDGDIPKTISEVPVSGTDVLVSDNEGYVWADHLSFECKYCGFSTSKGTLYLSYYPFTGGKEIGLANGQDIEVRLSDKKMVTLRSKTNYLPDSVNAIVYGVFFGDRKQGKYPSAGVMGRTLEKEFAEAVLHWPY